MEIQLLQMKLNGVILWIPFNLIQLCQNNLLRLPMEMVELPMLGKVKRYHIEERDVPKFQLQYIFGTKSIYWYLNEYQIPFVLMGDLPTF